MTNLILTFLILVVLFLLFWLLQWKHKNTFAVDLPLFLFSGLFLGINLNTLISFGDTIQFKIALAWVPILWWLYLRRQDTAFLFRYKFSNLIIGCIAGVVFGIIVVLLVGDSSISTKVYEWFLKLNFDMFQKAVAEELVFRCLFLNFLSKRISKDIYVNIVQGCVFGAFHIGMYWQFPYLLILPICFGILTGAMVLKQKSIYGSIFAHILSNLIIS